MRRPPRTFLTALLLAALLAAPTLGCAQQLADSPGYPWSGYSGAHDLLRGRLVEVRLVHPHTDQPFWLFRHYGTFHAGGEEGQPYEISLRNLTGERLLLVPSVDGVNTISGETASVQQSGYVLQPWQEIRIDGWRKSLDEVAQFVFTARSASYASQTGRPDNVGVIGLAVFRERVPLALSRRDWPADASPAMPSPRAPLGASAPPAASASPASPALADRARSAEAYADNAPALKAQPAEESLGTGHGQRAESRVQYTEFQRASERPAESLRLEYDSLRNLEARGIARLLPRRPQPPQPFPSDPFPGDHFVPDPPRG